MKPYLCLGKDLHYRRGWLKLSPSFTLAKKGSHYMCGIAGIFQCDDAPADAVRVAAMTAALAHRGPDGTGLWHNPRAALGHRRLAVIDLATGDQPMHSADGRFHLVFNGEIYNFRELRRELEAGGVIFRTRSDSEVLLELFIRDGERALPRLRGMFAFAVYDSVRHELFLARDRLGKKPLHYFLKHGVFAFASELQALRHAPQFPDEISAQAVSDYLSFQCIPAPQTAWCGVRKLPPAHFLRLRAGAAAPPEPACYWYPEFDIRHSPLANFSAAAAGLRAVLTEAVRDRLVADVPLGAFLSGGTDSACITGIMAGLCGEPVRTFTAGFAEGAYDERAAARRLAERFGTRHLERLIEPQDFATLRRLVHHAGEPFADASILPTHLIAKFAREQVTVALSGDGADELFGGYERYQAMRWTRRVESLLPFLSTPLAAMLMRLLPAGSGERTRAARLHRFLDLLQTPLSGRYFRVLNRFPEEQQARILGPRLKDAAVRPAARLITEAFEHATAPEPDARPAEVDLRRYLPDDILVKADIASMAASLETRSPFLDHRVVEFAAALPWEYKQHGGVRKRILLEACRDLLPPATRAARKRGFAVPLAAWFRAGWLPHLRETLLAPELRDQGFFNHAAVETMIADHAAARADHGHALFSLLVFQLWLRENHSAGL